MLSETKIHFPKLRNGLKRIRPFEILRSAHRTVGAAIACGVGEATKDVVVVTDPGYQFDLSQLPRLTDPIRHHDIVVGYRIDRQDRLIRRLGSAGYNALVRLLLGTEVRDCNCPLKVFRREVIQGIRIDSAGQFVNAEVLAKARLQGRSIAEVAVTLAPTRSGYPAVSTWQIMPLAVSVLRFWWNAVLFPRPQSDDEAVAPRWSSARESVALLLLCAVCCLVMFPRLFYPLIEPDESRYVQIALEMIESGNWITPTLDGQPYLDKPPLLYWMTATSISIFGPHELAARLPSVVCAILTVLLIFWGGCRILGSRGAWCGAIALLLCGGFVLAGRFLVMDSLLTVCTTASLIGGYLATSGPAIRWRWWIVAAIACALGILAKGPIAAVLCVPPLVANGWLTQSGTKLRFVHWGIFLVPISLMCVPWYIAISATNGEFGGYFFWKHNIMRFATGLNHQRPWWFYVPVVFAGMFPASLLLPTLAVFLLSRREAIRRFRSKEIGFLFLSVVWILAFFSLSSCKLPTYILPALPLLCLLLGCMLDRSVFRPGSANWIASYLKPFPQRANLIVLAACLLVAAMDLVIKDDSRLLPVLAILICIVLASLTIHYRNRPHASSQLGWSLSSAIGIAVVTFTFAEFVATASFVRSVHARAAELSRQSDLPVVYFGKDTYAASFYLPRERVIGFTTDQPTAFAAYLADHPGAVVVTSNETIESTRKQVALTTRLVEAGGRRYVYLSEPIEEQSPRSAADVRPLIR